MRIRMRMWERETRMRRCWFRGSCGPRGTRWKECRRYVPSASASSRCGTRAVVKQIVKQVGKVKSLFSMQALCAERVRLLEMRDRKKNKKMRDTKNEKSCVPSAPPRKLKDAVEGEKNARKRRLRMIICMCLQQLHVGIDVCMCGDLRRVNAMLQTRLTQSSHVERLLRRRRCRARCLAGEPQERRAQQAHPHVAPLINHVDFFFHL